MKRHSIPKSEKLADVLYDIRGPVLNEAYRMEHRGIAITKLNIGNPAPFGFGCSAAIRESVARHLEDAQGYCESKGLPFAREAIRSYYQHRGIQTASIDDVYIGNGVSELISTSIHALLNSGDEVLIPAPDYPLWTAVVRLSGGIPVHYRCDERAEWHPDIADIRAKIGPRTRAIVVINPNNPTGALYSRSLLEQIAEVAAQHRLVVLSDEIYDQVIYDNHPFYSMATVCHETLCIVFNGISKNYRACGYRAGWMLLCGNTSTISDYREGLDMLSNMRLCSNVLGQYAIAPALQTPNEGDSLIAPGGRLYQQREMAVRRINDIAGIDCVTPRATFYLFPTLDRARFNLTSDLQFTYDLLREARILVVQGSGFNCPDTHHFRMVFLPPVAALADAFAALERFLARYRQKNHTHY